MELRPGMSERGRATEQTMLRPLPPLTPRREGDRTHGLVQHTEVFDTRTAFLVRKDDEVLASA